MRAVIGLVFLTMSGQAIAGWYAGAGVGESKSEFFDDVAGITGVTTTDSDTVGKIFGGYQFNRNLAVEAAFADLGSYDITARSGSNFATSVLDVTAFSISGIGIVPVKKWLDLFAKVGIASWKVTDTGTSNVLPNYKDNYSGIDPVIGVGAKFNVKRVSFSVQAERYTDIGEEDETGVSDIDVIGVSASFNF